MRVVPIFFILVHSADKTESLFQDIADFCSNNGFDYLSIVTTSDTKLLSRSSKVFSKEIANRNIRSRVDFDHLDYMLDTLIVLTNSKDLFESLL